MRVQIKWEKTDKFLITHIDGSVKKDLHLVHVAYPDYKRLSMNVQVITFEPQEMPNIVDVSIDSVGRNYAVFWSKSKKDMNYSCSYYKVVFKNKIIVNKLSHTLLQCGFREIEWSRIENLFFFKTRGQIQVGHFDDVNAATPSKFTGVLNTIDISPNSEISYDSSGRYIGVYEPNILKYCVYNAFGLLRFVK